MADGYDPRHGMEQHRLKRTEAAYSMIQTWGSLVFKTLTALHSGLLVTIAALYTDKGREFASVYLAEASMVAAIFGLLLIMVGLLAAYFNGAFHLPEAIAGLDSLWESTHERRLAAEAREQRFGKKVDMFMKVAICAVSASILTFFCAVSLALLSL